MVSLPVTFQILSFGLALPLVMLAVPAWANCESLELDNYFETSEGQCIDLGSMGPSEVSDSQPAGQVLPSLRLGGSIAGFDTLEAAETAVTYGGEPGVWRVGVKLQNLGNTPADVAVIRYQVLDEEIPVYVGAIVPADGKLPPFSAASFEDIVFSQSDIPIDEISSLTVEVLEFL